MRNRQTVLFYRFMLDKYGKHLLDPESQDLDWVEL